MHDDRGKNGQTRKQIRGSALLLAGRMFALLTNLAVQILLVRYLAKSEYGSFAFALSMVAMGTNLSLLGLNRSLSRFVPIYHEQRDYKRMAGTSVLVFATVLGVALAIALIVFCAQRLLSLSVIRDDLSLTLLLLLVALVPVDALDNLFQSSFSVFAKVRAIFFRRHLLGPALKLMAIVGVMIFDADVQTLAICYLGAGVLGLLLYIFLLYQVLRSEGLLQHFAPRIWKFPARELFSYSVPLYSSQLGFLFRGALVVLLLEVLQSSEAVADFRAVLPFARLNVVVLESFTFLFTPIASRMFARDETSLINDLYWKSAIWVAVLTFPIFLATGVMSGPLTVFMLGEEYAAASTVMTVLALGYFFDAALGFTVQTLRVYAKVRYVVMCDVASIIIAVVLNVLLIPLYGAVGAAVATASAMITQNLLYLLTMQLTTSIGKLHWKYAQVYLSFALIGVLLIVVQRLLSPPLFVGLLFVAAASAGAVALNRHTLAAGTMFPELTRVPLLGRLLVSGNTGGAD